MKPIPGYEIVDGKCKDCEFFTGKIPCNLTVHVGYDNTCDNRKCYKKKEETMTHDEMIAVIQAHKDGKQIQLLDEQKTGTTTLTKVSDIIAPILLEIMDAISRGKKLRVKPEPKVIPWTADDWREFKDIKFNIKGRTFRVDNWRVFGINFTNDCNEKFYEKYEDLTSKKDINGKPCGKVVEE